MYVSASTIYLVQNCLSFHVVP